MAEDALRLFMFFFFFLLLLLLLSVCVLQHETGIFPFLPDAAEEGGLFFSARNMRAVRGAGFECALLCAILKNS